MSYMSMWHEYEYEYKCEYECDYARVRMSMSYVMCEYESVMYEYLVWVLSCMSKWHECDYARVSMSMSHVMYEYES